MEHIPRAPFASGPQPCWRSLSGQLCAWVQSTWPGMGTVDECGYDVTLFVRMIQFNVRIYCSAWRPLPENRATVIIENFFSIRSIRLNTVLLHYSHYYIYYIIRQQVVDSCNCQKIYYSCYLNTESRKCNLQYIVQKRLYHTTVTAAECLSSITVCYKS